MICISSFINRIITVDRVDIIWLLGLRQILESTFGKNHQCQTGAKTKENRNRFSEIETSFRVSFTRTKNCLTRISDERNLYVHVYFLSTKRSTRRRYRVPLNERWIRIRMAKAKNVVFNLQFGEGKKATKRFLRSVDVERVKLISGVQ